MHGKWDFMLTGEQIELEKLRSRLVLHAEEKVIKWS
jgi:hypothetical protein